MSSLEWCLVYWCIYASLSVNEFRATIASMLIIHPYIYSCVWVNTCNKTMLGHLNVFYIIDPLWRESTIHQWSMECPFSSIFQFCPFYIALCHMQYWVMLNYFIITSYCDFPGIFYKPACQGLTVTEDNPQIIRLSTAILLSDLLMYYDTNIHWKLLEHLLAWEKFIGSPIL